VSRLVVISNRVPLPSERGGARAGGLAVALADVLRPGSLWFGWSGRRSANADATAHIQQADRISYATIDLTEHEYRAFYLNFANGALWPLLHFRLGLLSFHREDYDGYVAVNRRFAEALKPLLRPDDLIWVHDYHLFPLADALRALGVGNRIGFFLHTPFVPPALLQALPRADELLRGMCAYDVIVPTMTGASSIAAARCTRWSIRSASMRKASPPAPPAPHSPSRPANCARACPMAAPWRSAPTGWTIPRDCPIVLRPLRGC
jgi:trehalose 6-phosphate synthase